MKNLHQFLLERLKSTCYKNRKQSEVQRSSFRTAATCSSFSEGFCPRDFITVPSSARNGKLQSLAAECPCRRIWLFINGEVRTFVRDVSVAIFVEQLKGFAELCKMLLIKLHRHVSATFDLVVCEMLDLNQSVIPAATIQYKRL